MTRKPTKKPAEEAVEPKVLEEPQAEEEAPGMSEEERNVWLRGLWMLLFVILFRLVEVVLCLAALLQFLWLLFGKQKNAPIAGFGEDLADWMARAARFQTGATEEKPFPFAKWGKEG